MSNSKKYLISPNILNYTLTQKIKGVDQDNNYMNTTVIKESSLTIFLNNQEIVTLMCVDDYPNFLAIGYLLNQNMIKLSDKVKSIDIDKDLGIVVIRTNRKTDYEKILKKKLLPVDVPKEQYLEIYTKK